jgi:hypothetical protein
MKRFLSFLALTLLWPIWRAPAWAQLTTLGVGGIAAVVIGTLITPSIVPQVSSYFNQNAANGTTNNALLPNGGTAASLKPGALEFPAAAQNSMVLYLEGSVNSALNYSIGAESALASSGFAGLQVSVNGPGQPSIFVQRNDGGGITGSQWWNAASSNTNTGAFSVTAGSGYNTGQFPFTITNSGCARDPGGVWAGQGGGAKVVDPGFLCPVTPPSLSLALIPGAGGRQSTGPAASPAQASTTCVSNSPVAGEMTVTAHLAIAHGVAPAQTYTMQGFTAQTGYNATYVALAGSNGTTLVGETTTGAGTCPTSPATQEGTALSGVGGTINAIAITPTNPWGFGATGITTRNAQHFCGIVGEYGADSNFPGAQFASFVDDKGNPLPGAPALVPWLNQGTANFTGYVTAGAQSPSSPALTVTAMNPYTITSWSYSALTGFVTFTMDATAGLTGFIPGSEFTVTGGGGVAGKTYVAVAGTTGLTIVGNPLSGPLGAPQANNPGVSGTGGTMVSVIMPNVDVLGTTNITLGGSVITPYGTFGSTGTGGVGTYALTANPATSTFTAKIDNGAGAAGTTLTTSGAVAPPLVVGSAFTGAGVSAGTIITAVLGPSTFTVNNSQLVATAELMTNAGTIGSSGSPVTLFAFPNHYFSAVAGVTATAPYGGVTTARSQATLGDFWAFIGSTGSAVHSGSQGWGGALANLSMLWGAFPQAPGGAPSTPALASLCKKTTGDDLQSFAAANNLTVHSLYKLNDPGVWADSGNATITGYIDSATNTVAGTATLHVLTTPYGSLAPPANQTAVLAGPGLAGVPISPPTIPLLSSGATATYTVTFAAGITSANLGSVGSPVTFSVGAFKPALPITSNNLNGYIDNGGGSTPTLHVTSIPPSATTTFTGTATFTATLGNTLTGNIPIGNTLNVTAAPGNGYTPLGVATRIIGAGIPANTVVTGIISITNSATGVGSYTLNNSVSTAVPSEAMFATGTLPAAASSLMVSSVSNGTIAGGMYVTDGGVNVTGSPIFISTSGPTVNSLPTWVINQTYYPANITYSGLVGTLTTLVPGQYIQGATSSVGLTTPVSIVGYGTGTGGVGTYLLSNNSANGVGSAGSPVAFISTGIGDAGAVAPGPALTIKDLGAGVAFPVTNFSGGTGALTLSGTFDTSALGGSPTTIQAQISLTAGGLPVPGCAACAWTNLSGYSTALSSGTVFDWSGQALNIPAGAPLFVSVRAANGAAYATMPSYIKVGLVFDWQGEGQTGAAMAPESGTANSYFTGLWGLNQWFGSLDQGPPVVSNYAPGQTVMQAGDRFGVLGGGVPLAEGVSVYEQLLTNAFGYPVTVINTARDGIGITPETMGGVTQTQTVGLGDGSTKIWCSDVIFCPTAGVSPASSLFFNAATQTGANVHATISATTLTTQTLDLGALEPGMSIAGAGIAGSPTLVSCLTGCIPTGVPLAYPNVQTWTISASQSVGTSEAIRLDPPGGAPWPDYDIQSVGLSFVNGGFGTELVQAGTFQVSVDGTPVCQDTNTFAYNSQSGNCTGAGVSGFVNYATGDYQVTFTTAPTGPITASWTNIISPDANQSPLVNRPQGFDFFGNGKSDSGPMSSAFAKTPGGVTAHVFAGGVSDDKGISGPGFQFGAPAYTQAVSWLYGTRFPAILPGQSASTPFFSANEWRGEGPDYFSNVAVGFQAQSGNLYQQWSLDVATKSTFSGSIASGVLTLSAAASGPMWEGEVVDCATVGGGCGLSQASGVYITGLDATSPTGWGASGSKYDLAGASGVTATGAMQNAVYYLGPGPALYSGPMNDVPVQASVLSQTTGYSPHMANGAFAGRRVGARWAAQTWGNLTNQANASDPTVDRVKADASGCDTLAQAAPCFDIGNTFAASHSGMIAGAQITVTGGIAANSRPFVVGQLLSCAGCTAGRFITSIDVPATQSTVTGQGEVGQTFRITASASLLTGPTTEAVTAGCSGISGTGSNCIDVAFQINTTNGSYGTAAAIATCGENNLNGIAPNYVPPNGVCQTNGIGSLVRTFRIGNTQFMNGSTVVVGSPYDDGDDPVGGVFNQSAAFTCNLVAAKVVQCVKGPAYASGVPSSIGQWTAGATFVEYGDPAIGTSRIASLQGFVGGQSFPITTPGSGQMPATYPGVVGTGCGVTSGGVTPKMDLTVDSTGKLVNAYPSTAADAMGLGVGTACLFTVPGSAGGTPGTVQTVVAPVDGWGGIATYNTDSNMMGDMLYDNSGLPNNPLNQFFTNGMGGYFEPGLPVIPFGEFMGAQVSG